MSRKEELQSLIEEQEKKLKELNSELDAVKKEEQRKREQNLEKTITVLIIF